MTFSLRISIMEMLVDDSESNNITVLLIVDTS